MSGDVSGQGDVKFHVTGFVQPPKWMGGQSLADVIMHDFEMIMNAFKKSLVGGVADLKRLRKLAGDLTALTQLLNAVITSKDSPQQSVDQLNSAIGKVKADIRAIFPNYKTDPSPYYKSLMESLNSVQGMLKGGVIQVLKEIEQETGKIEAWLKKEIHANHKQWIDSGEDKTLAKQLEGMLNKFLGYYKDLESLMKNWPTNLAGPLPSGLKDVWNRVRDFKLALFGSTVGPVLNLHGLHEMTLQYALDHGKLAWFIRAVFFVGGDGSRMRHYGWHDLKLRLYVVKGLSHAFHEADKAIASIKAHDKLGISSATIIAILREMASGTKKGDELKNNLPGVWQAYQQALRSADQMMAESTSLNNDTVSTVYSTSTALQQLIKTLSKDLQVPIEAVDQSIARIFQ